MKPVFGTLYDGQHSARHACSLYLDEAGLVHLDGVKAEPQSLATLRFSPRVAATARLVYFDNGAIFETRDNTGIDALQRAQQGKRWFDAHRWETSIALAGFTALLAVLMIPLTAFVLIPWASNSLAMRLPEDILERSGKELLLMLDQQWLADSQVTEDEQQRLQQLFASLLPEGRKYRLLFREGGSVGANALALPDNTIIVTDQFLALARNDEEIISVLFHEIGHLEHRHAVKKTLEGMGLAIMAIWLIGDVDSVSGYVLSAPTVLLVLKFSRDHEREADHYALEQMAERGIESQHLANILLRLSQQVPPPEDSSEGAPSSKQRPWVDYLRTHPTTEERAAYILGKQVKP